LEIFISPARKGSMWSTTGRNRVCEGETKWISVVEFLGVCLVKLSGELGYVGGLWVRPRICGRGGVWCVVLSLFYVVWSSSRSLPNGHHLCWRRLHWRICATCYHLRAMQWCTMGSCRVPACGCYGPLREGTLNALKGVGICHPLRCCPDMLHCNSSLFMLIGRFYVWLCWWCRLGIRWSSRLSLVCSNFHIGVIFSIALWISLCLGMDAFWCSGMLWGLHNGCHRGGFSTRQWSWLCESTVVLLRELAVEWLENYVSCLWESVANVVGRLGT
jgi:hypothetical protein